MAKYSHSRLESFRKCPRQFYYRYVAKVPLEDAPEQIATFLGTRCHETLEHLYKEVARRRLPGLDELLSYFAERWKAEWTKDIVILDEQMKPADYRKIGTECVRDYYRRFQPFDQSRTIGLERRVEIALDRKGEYRMLGYIDRLAKADGGVWQVHDYKTNQSLPTQQDKDRDPQLAYYEIGIRQMWPDAEEVELYWHFLRFDHTIKSTRTSAQLDELRRETVDVIKQIEGRDQIEKAFPTRESALCNYCDYQHVCPVRKHLCEVRALAPSRFAKESGVKLVDHWADLQAQRQKLIDKQREIEAEIAEIQEALIKLAEKKGLSTVVGREKEATVTATEAVSFPTKTHDAETYDSFEAKLRQSKWWDEVSTLDRHALKRLWDRHAELNAVLRQLLSNYATPETDVSVRLRKRRG